MIPQKTFIYIILDPTDLGSLLSWFSAVLKPAIFPKSRMIAPKVLHMSFNSCDSGVPGCTKEGDNLEQGAPWAALWVRPGP